MAITFDAGGSGAILGGTTFTVAHTCSGSDRALVVTATCGNGTDFLAGATITYGGVSMGSPRIIRSVGASLSMYTWVLAGPLSGSNNIVLTATGGTYTDVVWASFTGVDQASPVSAAVEGGSIYSVTSRSDAITVPAGGMAVDALSIRNTSATLTAHASQTTCAAAINTGASKTQQSYKTDATAMVWTFSGTDQNVAHNIVALAPAASGAVNGSATSGTGTSTGTGTGGDATAGGGTGGTATSGAGTSTGSGTGGAAAGGAGGSFVSDAMENNTGAGLLSSTAVVWTWYQGAIGAAPTSPTHGTGTTSAAGVLTIASGLPSGAGFLLVRTADASGVYYQPGTVS